MSSRRIAVVSHAWSDDLVGGAFKVATDWARYLASCGHQVHYLCGGDPALPSRRTIDGVQVWCYSYPERSGLSALKWHLQHSRQLFEHLQVEQVVDAIAGHSPLQYLGALDGGGSDLDTRMYSVHSPFADEIAAAGRNWKNWPQRTMAWYLDRQCLDRSTMVTTDSRYTLQRLQQMYGERRLRKAAVRSAWVDTDRFQPVEDRAASRRRLGGPWQTELPILMTLRRLETRMGLDRLIDAAAKVRDGGQPFRLLIGGGGSLHAALQSKIEQLGMTESVFLLGRLSDQDLPICYASADCFVLPTTALECFGLIILEAYACGTPVIATPVAAIPEIVRQASDDWLTADASSEAIAQQMSKFLSGQLQADRRQLRQIALNYSVEKRAASLTSFMLGHREPSSHGQQAASDAAIVPGSVVERP